MLDRQEKKLFKKELTKTEGILFKTDLRAIQKCDTNESFEKNLEALKNSLQAQEMYTLSSSSATRTITLTHKTRGWPSQFIFNQLKKHGELWIKVCYHPNFSTLNRIITTEMNSLKVQENCWFNVRVRCTDGSDSIYMSDAVHPLSTKDMNVILEWEARHSHVTRELYDGQMFLDSELRLVSIIKNTQKQIIFDEVNSVDSIVDVINHMKSKNKTNKDFSVDYIFDIHPLNYKMGNIPLNFLYDFDVQTRLHSPYTLRVFFNHRELKNDKVVKTQEGFSVV